MKKYLNYVNIKQGTDSQHRFSNGNTLPLTALPHALAAFAPQTDGKKKGWFYHPKDRSIEGIRLTHQPSPWLSDFSYLTFMPQAERIFVTEESRWSGYRVENAELFPHYMKIKFLRYKAELSLAPTDSGAVMNIIYDDKIIQPRFAVCPADFDGEIIIDEDNSLITGYTTSKSGQPENDDFKCFFAFKFDCQIFDCYTTDGNKPQPSLKYKGRAAGCNVALKGRNVNVAFAQSYISATQALLNLNRETEAKTFQAVKDEAEKIWENILSLIEVKGKTEKMRTFYSCMYRAFLFPTKFYEIDKDGNAIHINPETNKVKSGVLYTNNGFWDTFRTVYPFYSIVIPKKLNEILCGFLNFYDDTGFLPRWPSPSEAGFMPGTLIEAVFADAIVKDILSKSDAQRALNAMLKNAEVQSQNPKQGRKNIDEYNSLGYISYSCHESVNETLDCAYGDYCIAVTAQKLGREDIAQKYFERSKNYRNLFDKESGFMRARDKDGNFRPDFSPYNWGTDYTEGGAWQTSFSVPHDIEGLASLYGGKQKLIEKIDELFNTEPFYIPNGYGIEIHEMTEMAAVDFGQCAISNQPSFHIPYIYSELGEKNQTIKKVTNLLNKAFSSADDGFPGDEDNGTTACWYIFSSMGFYPLCPGRPDYTLSKPCFNKIILTVNGKKINLKSKIKRQKGTKISHSKIIN